MMKENHKILFEPIKIGKLELKNRYVMAPMGPGGLCDEQGCYNEKGVEYYVRRAQGGTGLIMTGVTYVENEIEKCVMPSMPCPTVNPLNFIKTAKPMTERVHAYGAKIFSQLSGGFGRVSIPSIVGKVAVGPSPIPHRFLDDVICRELTVEEIHTYIRKFAEAAAVCKKAGFDGVEIHAVHEGYLLDQFAISFYNQRTDEYGGSLANRLRFATEIVQAIKQECGQDYPVSLRYSLKSFVKDWREGALPGEEFQEKGRDIEEGKEAARLLVEAGYDALNADVGTYDSWYWNHPPMYHEKGMYLPYNEILKTVVDVPVITAGRMENPDLASEAIRKGQTDMIALGRPLLADPDIPNKIMRGEFEEVRPCLSCQEGCMGRLAAYAQISCAVNPACGREAEYGLTPAMASKEILIVGGGVAGMEAARVLAMRGFNPVVFEKQEQAGGQIVLASKPPKKEKTGWLVEYQKHQLEKLGVEVRLNTAPTMEELKALEPYAVFVSQGSKPIMPRSIKGIDGEQVYTPVEILNGSVTLKDKNVCVVGSGMTGIETAELLCEQGNKVSVFEMADDIGPGIFFQNLIDVLGRVNSYGTMLYPKHRLVELDGTKAVFETTDTKEQESYEFDAVVVSLGTASNTELKEEIEKEFEKVEFLGDALKAGRIENAIRTGYLAAAELD